MRGGVTRREMIGASALALGLAGSIIEPLPAQVLPSPDPARVGEFGWSAGAFTSDTRRTLTRISASAVISALSPRPESPPTPRGPISTIPTGPRSRCRTIGRSPFRSQRPKLRRQRTAQIPWPRTGSRRSAAISRKTASAGTASRSRSHRPTRARRIWLEFDGVFRDCLVFVNGYVAGRNESGYAPFRVEIDDFLNYDGKPNVVTVRADASLGEGWFYEGAGIYRHVDLVSRRAGARPALGDVRPQRGRGGRRAGPHSNRGLQQRRRRRRRWCCASRSRPGRSSRLFLTRRWNLPLANGASSSSRR